MTPNEVRREIERFGVHLLSHGIAVEVNAIVIRRNGDEQNVTWSSPVHRSISLSALPFGTLSEFRNLLADRQYSYLLSDGSFIQATYLFEHGEVVGHRLAYYPSPVDLRDVDLFGEETMAEIIDLSLYEAIDAVEWSYPMITTPVEDEESGPGMQGSRPGFAMKSPIRFDFDPKNERELHPASHVHLLIPECRLPVHAPLSFGQFIRFVFRNFQPDLWNEHAFLREWPTPNLHRCIAARDEEEFFLECRRPIAAA